MTRLMKLTTLLCILWALVHGTVAPVWGASLFSGLVLSQGEQEGVRVIEVYPSSPSGKAGIKVADLIVELDGGKIGSLDDFVVKSRNVDKKVPEVAVKVLRKGKLVDFIIASYSMPVYQSWKVKVVEPPYTVLSGASLLQYWIEKGRGKLMENQGNIPADKKIANCREAIKSFFFALHYSPASVDIGLMLADTYKTLAELYQSEGSLLNAIRSYAMAAELYDKSGNKATNENDLQKVLAGLQDVEERLFLLLPQEEPQQQ